MNGRLCQHHHVHGQSVGFLPWRHCHAGRARGLLGQISEPAQRRVSAAGRRRSHGCPVLAVGFLAQYLPWVLVPRSMYIYHYFASVPFIILATAWWLDRLPRSRPRLRMGVMALYLVGALVFFVMFFPYASGWLTSTGVAGRDEVVFEVVLLTTRLCREGVPHARQDVVLRFKRRIRLSRGGGRRFISSGMMALKSSACPARRSRRAATA